MKIWHKSTKFYKRNSIAFSNSSGDVQKLVIVPESLIPLNGRIFTPAL